jgi:hypothetical protein
MQLIRAAGMSLLGALLLSVPAGADQVVLGASQDNTMFQEDGSVSNGVGEYFFVGRTKDGFTRRGLVAFDIAGSIPPGSVITGVTLGLNMSRTRTQNQTVSLLRVLASWGEGTSNAGGEERAGASATPNDATWTHRLWPTSTWSTNGGDFHPTVSGSATVGNQTCPYSWSSAGMAADVQAWPTAACPTTAGS